MESVKKTAPVDIDTFEIGSNDSENAKLFVRDRNKWVRYVPAWGVWLLRDAKTNTWARDNGDGTGISWLAQTWAAGKLAQAKALTTESEEEAVRKGKLVALVRRLGGSDSLSSVIRLARGNPAVVVDTDEIDSDPWLIGTESGILDLRTREIVVPEGTYITRKVGVGYAPGAPCERWEAFIREIMLDREEMVGYLRRAMGYSLVGTQAEKVLFFLYGGGDNGKSVFVNTVFRTLSSQGGYAVKCGKKLIAETRAKEQPLHDIAELHGRRFALGSEVAEGEKLNEDVVKDITGGDPLTGCRKYEHPFTFEPQCTLWLYGNHKPEVRGTDKAIWRRMRCIPFPANFTREEQDPDLGDKLWAEREGIFRWMVDACAEWQATGLGTAPEIEEAVEEYRKDSDEMGLFIEEVLEITGDKDDGVGYVDLYTQFRAWNEEQGSKFTVTRAKFTRKWKERFKGEEGVKEYDHAGGRGVRGMCGMKIRDEG